MVEYVNVVGVPQILNMTTLYPTPVAGAVSTQTFNCYVKNVIAASQIVATAKFTKGKWD